MLEPLFGSLVREQVLIFINAYGDGYAREIARFFKAPLDSVQKQLKRLENGGILIGARRGRTLIYEFNEGFEYLSELLQLLDAIIHTYAINFDSTDSIRSPRSNHKTDSTRVTVKRYVK